MRLVGEDPEITPGGSRIQRHDEARPPEMVPSGWEGQERIEEHVAQHLGPIETVFHELVSEFVHLDVLIVEPTDERPFRTLVTCGMSSRPMEAEDPDDRYAELLIALPADWPMGEEAWSDDRNSWPVRALKQLARMPHEYGFELGVGHTVPNGDPAEPYARGTDLCCALVAPGQTTPEAFDALDLPEGTVRFHALYFMHPGEVDLKLEQGMDALWSAYAEAGVTEIVDPGRPSVAGGGKKKRFGLF